MAENIFVKADKLGKTALGLLRSELKGAALFKIRYGVADYAGAKGDTIMIKRPPILKARDAGFRKRNELVVDELMESKIAVKLTRHPYSRVGLSPEEETLDEIDYATDVQDPQVRAISVDFDESITGALRAATFVNTVNFTPGTADRWGDPRKVARRAKRLLDDFDVPATGRYWIVGSAVSEEIATCEKLLDVDKSGLPEALRDGVVGKLSGFVIIDWPTCEEDESFFVHDEAVALSSVAPVVPNGAAAGASVAGDGIAVTQVWDYGSGTMTDQSTVHAFTGADVIPDPKIVATGTRKGLIELKDDEPVMHFVRAVKVNFTEPTEDAGTEG